MKNNTILILIVLTLGCGQPRQKDFVVKDAGIYDCILINFERKGFSCGVFAHAEAMKFNLQEKGDMNIAVVIRCPEAFGEDYWTLGGKYTLTLTSDSSICKEYQVFNLYRDSLQTFFALNVVKN